MITKEEISKIQSFNLPLLLEATRQVELKINDEHNRKERIDKRAYTLVSTSLIVLGIIFGLVKSNCFKNETLTLLGASAFLITSLIFLFRCLKSQKYSPQGTNPSTWLLKEFIQSYEDKFYDERVYCNVLACILRDSEEGILASETSNEYRITLLNKAILMLQFTIIPVCISIIYKSLITIYSWLF